MTPAFEKYLQDNYPKIWQGWGEKTLAPNERWLVQIAEKAFEAGRQVGVA
jgi:hypothetical protein